MRHRIKREKLNRDYDHRRALVRNLLRALLLSGKVETSQAKGRVLLRRGEKLISRVMKKKLTSRRFLFRFFQDQKLVNQIEKNLISSFGKKKSGFLRMRKVKRRRGDNAIMVRVEFVPEEKKIKEEKKK